ncbi:MAG: hypothetical protein KC619_23690 [Myxococcales bacterium]|nr:hypothetical protein [Myxococcales bacterium]
MKAHWMFVAIGWAALIASGCGDGTTSDAGTPGMDAAVADAGGATDAGTDAASVDAGTDAGTADAGSTDAGEDAGPVDAGPPPVCGGSTMGSCPSGLTCLCCDLGGPASRCLCTTECTTSDMCTDTARGTCDVNVAGGAPTGLCRGDDFSCCWGCD